MTRVLTLAALALAAIAPPAAADDTWRASARSAEQARADAAYDQAMQEGDGAVESAVMTHLAAVRQRLIDRAIAAYELAARARPTDPEPHFRALSVLRAFHDDCRPVDGEPCLTPMTPARAQRLLDHAEAFAALAPDDPRLVEEVLGTTAILRTRLGTDADLRAAGADYRRALELSDGDLPTALGNLAEVYMMLGQLDQAIETYRRALAGNHDLGMQYGLAVALDRDEQPGAAGELIAELGPAGLARFVAALGTGQYFFVPAGEEHYYLALAAEVLGEPVDALEHWDAFLDSGAHPRYAPRARAHRDALAARLGRRRPARPHR